MEKILIFYKYVAIPDTAALLAAQQELCGRLGLKGRIILAHEGINGTVGGTYESTQAYKHAMLNHPLFSDMDIKESDGTADNFPRLRIVIKEEIVHLGLDPKRVPASRSGIHLTPQQAHDLIASKPDDLVIFDTRNSYESCIGAFKGAITPTITKFREVPNYIDKNLDLFKNKRVLFYCTAGVRCERASAYLKLQNVAQEVYQLTGGIHRYVEAYPDGYFKGKNYVFDGRIALPVTRDILAHCLFCAKPYDEYTNCVNVECNKHIIVCPPCLQRHAHTCGAICCWRVESGIAKKRTIPLKQIKQN